jgi:hypothetical protein
VAEIVKFGFGGPRGTIWIPLMGALLYPLVAAVGIADRVKPETDGIVRTT